MTPPHLHAVSRKPHTTVFFIALYLNVFGKTFRIASNDRVIGTHLVDLGVAGKIILNGMRQCGLDLFREVALGGELLRTRR